MAEQAFDRATYVVHVEVDTEWYRLKGALADQPCPPESSRRIVLTSSTSAVGRTSRSRGLYPEVALDGDTGVSRRHAQLYVDGDQLTIVDLSSTNGTYVVAAGEAPATTTRPITAGVPTVLRDGDRVLLGAWSRLRIGHD